MPSWNPDKEKARLKRLYRERIAAGYCGKCGKDILWSKALCECCCISLRKGIMFKIVDGVPIESAPVAIVPVGRKIYRGRGIWGWVRREIHTK